MLKIKDNIDLKELEKFGFKWDENLKEYYIFSKQKDEKLSVAYERYIIIKDFSGFSITVYFDIIFDLIQAGLVEKVEGM